ncbi:hypothetical protein HF086_001600 [Spodoptera exigua]|uniref:Uncharacterized protein n=1 Tax=Spodoptera exigua TaxID=7107 RepID=A0A922MQA5_SPOEX|nr:hypothetical protein HF086_001600 [Spodoptera exigua]
MPIGKLEPFSLSSKQWPAYIRRVNQYILLNDVKDNLKVPMLITVVGESTYAVMCDLCSPDFPENKTYEELVNKDGSPNSEVPSVRTETEDTCEDASDEVGEYSHKSNIEAAPEPVTSPPSPPPGASARALRAHNRARLHL